MSDPSVWQRIAAGHIAPDLKIRMPPRRDERTMDEAEAERRGYERAKAQAMEIASGRGLMDGSRAMRDGYALACRRIATAIARMQPEDKT